MSNKLESPVQTQMVVAVPRSPLSREYHGNQGLGGKPSTGRRRVFVQTDKGCVLGMELDRSDNAHTVKRRLQVALNVSTEESSLTFGDIVLKNDLSAIRNDSLLLTRNLMHRSSSTPCLSPTGRDLQHKDKSGPIEILGQSSHLDRMNDIVNDIKKAIKMGIDPTPVHSGLGGAYFFRNIIGENVAIVKPTDEEPFAPNNPKGFVGKALGQPGLKHSVRVGETGFREVAAYLLDYDHFANVPPTALVKITHSIFNVNDGVNGNNVLKKKLVSKIASLQKFIPHDFDASDHGTSSFLVSSVHRIGILDIRILNTDRHAGNLLVKKLHGIGTFGQVELIPIDHGLCLPESLEDPYFEWIHWPQASIPFSEDELAYIRNFDPAGDCDMLRRELPMIREGCLRVLVLCTIFLKEAATFGLCLAEIGEMMTREFRRGEEEPSELEVVCLEARKLLAEREELSPRTELGDDEFLFDIDYDEAGYDSTLKMAMENPLTRSPFQTVFGNGFTRSPLSKLDECIEEGEEEGDEDSPQGLVTSPAQEKIPTISKLSVSLKNTMLGEKNQNHHKYSGGNVAKKYSGGKADNGYFASTSSGHRSANEQLPASIGFVKLVDMTEDEWTVFLEKFQELLYPAFAKRKSITLGQRQRQRLGTSCQF
ncbi:putative 1-phosphatidylinositol 4-kinase [Lupinus albus]|uniref:1-phosphatidylinositol 4-kinase n=1 Tax=Lupinus albus TaxID=3870 RepID=A0A6A4QPI7_LUPAL|nr:putative 1-phosphatidylinositol 4-kinase [Lupinus albus]